MFIQINPCSLKTKIFPCVYTDKPLQSKNQINQGADSLKQDKKRVTLHSPELKNQADLLLQWKQEQNYEMSALDCLGLSEEKALKKARRKIKNKVRCSDKRYLLQRNTRPNLALLIS